MIKRLLFVLVFGLIPLLLWGESNEIIERMRRERAELEEQLARQEQILTSTESSIQAQISNLNIVSAKLKERTRMLEKTRSEIRSLNREISRLESEIVRFEKEHEQCKERYAQACQFFQRQNANLNQLTFILATDSFREMGRRARYVSEYSGSLREMAQELMQKKDSLESVRSQILIVKDEKSELQKVQQRNEEETRKEQREQNSLVSQLKNRRSTLKKEIAAQQKRMDALSKEIDRQIQLAVKTIQTDTKNAQPAQEIVKLSGNFEQNKGKLPIPITGPYLIVGEYGVQNVAGMKDVKQKNLGIDIQGGANAQARAVFDGTVSSIFQHGKGQIGVIIRHGAYMSVYCNLSETRLKNGDKIKTQEIVGNIQTSDNGMPVLHFQLHKESTRLNPSEWLNR